MQESWEIKGHTIEFLEEEHIYLCDGMILPSITQILQVRFGNKYDGIPKEIMRRASELGTAVHKAIEDYERFNINDVGCTELRNWKFLKKAYKFKCIRNEVPIILFKNDEPVACGRLDLVLEENGQIGLGDIKRTNKLDKEYLGYQLNLYRIGYQQCYDTEIKFLRGVHLRDDVRKYAPIPINEELTMQLLNEFLEKEK